MKPIEGLVEGLPWWPDYDDFEDEWKVFCTRKNFPDGSVTLSGTFDKKTACFIAACPDVYAAAHGLLLAYDARTLTPEIFEKLREALCTASARE